MTADVHRHNIAAAVPRIRTAAACGAALKIRSLEAICHRGAKCEVVVLPVRDVGSAIRLIDVETKSRVPTKVVTDAGAERADIVDTIRDDDIHAGTIPIRERPERSAPHDGERPEGLL